MTAALQVWHPAGSGHRGDDPGQLPTRPEIARPVFWGVAILLVFLGGFGSWAAHAPLSSAIVAPGSVAVETKRKTVQHLEGGIVRRILVREGEHVTAGRPLVELDITQAQAAWQIKHGQLMAERALEARLIAERDGLERIVFPPDLSATGQTGAAARTAMAGQTSIFHARLAALDGQRQILTERIAQLRSEIVGLEAQLQAIRAQQRLIRAEIADVQALVDRGLERRPRLLALERSQAELAGRLGEGQSAIAKARQAIGETALQIIDLGNRRAEEVVAELGDAQAKIADLREQVTATEDVLQRRSILAPVSGSVVNLQTVTAGGIATPGAALMEIVPEDDKLTIQAKIRLTDIDSVRPGLAAKIRLIAFKAWLTPTLSGKLTYVSADSLVDERSGDAYYDARITVARQDPKQLEYIGLYPGMPVQVLITTGARPLLTYLLQPLLDSAARAFRED
ncbi:MAG: HlyD family type I secretion periplasmic adaptor subunit [Alphaproteobacteria bacterium]